MGKSTTSARAVIGTGLILCASAVPGGEPGSLDCADWDTREFFEAAGPQDIAACLDAGADPDVGLLRTTHLAAKFQMLLDAGADPNVETSEGMPLIYMVVRWASPEQPADVPRILLAAGADPNARFTFNGDGDAHGETALHVASHPEVAQALIAGGADPNITDTGGMTPLHKAESGSVAEVLIAAGADPRAATANGWTPLHSAGRHHDGSVTQVLLARDVDVDAHTVHGVTPLHVATSSESAALLIAAGADVRRRDRSGRTPLHVVAELAKRAGSIGILVSAGARVAARDELGQTPLHKSVLGSAWADEDGRSPTIRALIDRGADIDARDRDGNTPLHLAAMSAWNAAGAAIDTLLDAGAVAGLRNEKGQTAWELAAQNENEDLKESEAYWRLNEARFESADGDGVGPGDGRQPAEATQAERTQGPAADPGESRAGETAGPRNCEIPGFPSPDDVRSMGLSWCPSSVDFQLRAIALQASGAWCGILKGSASTPDEIAAGHGLVDAACDRLDALAGGNSGPSCRCPSGYRP